MNRSPPRRETQKFLGVTTINQAIDTTAIGAGSSHFDAIGTTSG